VCPFRALAGRAGAYPAVGAVNDDLPFHGGWIGFVTYEAGLAIEGIGSGRRRDPAFPLVRFALYDSAAIYDHVDHQWYVIAVDWPPGTVRRPPVAERLSALRRRLAEARAVPRDSIFTPTSGRVEPNMSYEAYLGRVHRAKRYIEAGDVYQVNLAQRFTARTDASPLALYLRLRRSNPSTHAALLRWGDAAILSSSPELFLRLRHGRVVTRPIKGTRPRLGDATNDDASRRALSDSDKDRAELNMIIDLLRNDLGRVCSFGTVKVVSSGAIEEHPTVFHRVATIEGELDPHLGWVDLLRATFPGGSVTGAPKIRAMQIIDELERTPRGVYCGSIGWIGLDGSVSLNLAIRTMVQVRGVVHIHAGGAIVADSDPNDEYDEIMAKAAGMFQAMGCGPPSRSSRPRSVTVQ
jgi:para-aminobenzoate synthetase component 1